MKKTFTILLAMALALSLTACGGNGASSSVAPVESGTTDVNALSSSEASSTSSQTDTPTEDNKILVVYFSKTNNTKTMGDMIATRVGGDVLHVQPQTPYPEDYTETTELAIRGSDVNDAKPEVEQWIDASGIIK